MEVDQTELREFHQERTLQFFKQEIVAEVFVGCLIPWAWRIRGRQPCDQASQSVAEAMASSILMPWQETAHTT